MSKHRWLRTWLASTILIAGAVLAGPASAAGLADAWITAKLKASLLTAPDFTGADVDIDTRDRWVTLHGLASTDAEKARAESIAREVDGVWEVRNLIQVVPNAQRARVSASDQELQQRVENMLRRDPTLDGITVRSVNLGLVLLGGTAASLSDHLRVLELTRGVSGVRRVASEIESPDRLADAEIRRTPDGAGEPDTVRSTARDLWITSAARLKLLATRSSLLDVDVDTRGGVVTLFGAVGSPAEKSAAESDVAVIGGVQAVRNQLQVVPAERRLETMRKDEQIEQEVQQRLRRRQDLYDADIDVAVHDGVVRLTGSVANQDDRLAALTTARSGAGVRSVVGDLRVEQD